VVTVHEAFPPTSVTAGHSRAGGGVPGYWVSVNATVPVGTESPVFEATVAVTVKL
jgi:hypothetical protein